MSPPRETRCSDGWLPRPPRVRAALGALLLSVLAACEGGAEETDPPRGVLLITVDTLRADHLGSYGGPGDLTPYIDRLAGEGTLFLDTSTPVPITLPAHASLFTGVAPPVHGVRDNGDFRLGVAPPTLAERLADGGWTGAAFVGAVVLDAAYGLDRGFAHYDDAVPIPLQYSDAGASSYPDRPAAEVVDATLRWLQRRPAGSRFLAWAHLFDPHAPYLPPEPYRSRWGATYRGEIAYTDAQVGRLLEGLARLELADETLVILTADHGEGLGDHGETTHGFFLYQSTVHVPLILRLPGRLPAGARIAGAASLLDVLPTILDLLGLEPSPEAAGMSLTDAARGDPLPERTLYLESYLPYFQMRWSGSRGLRAGSWKYLRATGAELYDLAGDPNEARDLASDREEIVRRLGATLDATARQLDEARAGAGPVPGLDATQRARLRSLGYLSGDVGGVPDDLPARAAARPDTRERIQLVDRLLEAAPAAIDRRDPAGLRELGDLARLDPENPRLLAIYGNALLRHDRPADALAALERAVHLAPDDPRAQGNLAVALLRVGREEDARTAIDRSAALGASNPEVLQLHASLLIDIGDPVAAEGAFRALLDDHPDDPAAQVGLGRALAAQRRWAEALPELDDYLARDPGSLKILVLAGTAAYRLQRYDEAERRLRRALEIEPDLLAALLGLGLVFGERGDDAGAARILERAVGIADDDPEVWTLYGVAAARSGNVAAGRRALERALALDPDQPRVRELLRQMGG